MGNPQASAYGVVAVLATIVLVVFLWAARERPRQNALAKRDEARRQEHPSHEPVSKLSVPPPQDPPRTVPEDEIVEFYPVGKTVRCVGMFAITGRGSSADWVFKDDTEFLYQYLVVCETKVIENRGTAVVFEVWFPQAVQLRAESRHTLELHPPNSSLVPVLWPVVETQVLDRLPPYQIVRNIATVLNTADPRLKQTLTVLQQSLKSMGVDLSVADIPLTVKPNDLDGMRFKIDYVSGLGVSGIEVLDGKSLDPDHQRQLAYHAALFVDYFVGQAADLEEGRDMDVRVQDVSSALALGIDASAQGELTLRLKEKEDNSQDANAHKPYSVLEIVGGEVVVDVDDHGVQRRATLTPEPGGYIRYSKAKKLVRRAQVRWRADAEWFSRDHLLFGATGMRNVEIQSYYEADEFVDGPAATP